MDSLANSKHEMGALMLYFPHFRNYRYNNRRLVVVFKHRRSSNWQHYPPLHADDVNPRKGWLNKQHLYDNYGADDFNCVHRYHCDDF